MSAFCASKIVLSAPLRNVRVAPTAVQFNQAPDGITYVRSAHSLGAYPDKLTECLDHWAAVAPDRVFLAQRTERGDWRTKTYSEFQRLARNIAQALLDRDLSSDRPIAILSGNDIEHALLSLGAMYVGVPCAPISPAYSLLSSDFGKLRVILGLLTPGLIFASDLSAYSKAISAVLAIGAEIVTGGPAVSGLASTPFSELETTAATSAVDEAYGFVGPDTIAKILFTSGSTGTPKGVINTQRMLCSNQEIGRTVFGFLEDEPPVMCDWLPWNHTFGGNANFGLNLYYGGSLYIDEGKPAPGGVETTIRNLNEIAPNIYFNVPKGYEALIPYLRGNRELREKFFSRLKMMYYAGAGLSQTVWDELQRLAIETCGQRILMLTGLGSTETGPHALFADKDVSRAGDIGTPAPGVELKLVPCEGKLEARLRSPSITPGYWKPELSGAAFDEEGFYKLGDALKFVEAGQPSKGFLFDGRISEDFKLATGTWVRVGPLRVKLLAHCSPYVQDIVIAGSNRDEVTGLILPNLDVCRELCPELADGASPAEVFASPGVRNMFARLLEAFAALSTGSSNRITKALLMDQPLSIDLHEVTDKGSINQSAVLSNRAALVEELYAPQVSARVITINGDSL